MRAKSTMAIVSLLVLAACSGDGQTTTTLSSDQILTEAIQAADKECAREAAALEPRATTTTTSEAPAVGTSTPPTTAAPVEDPVKEYVEFATAISLRRTKFEKIIKDKPELASRLEPIARAYADADDLAQRSILPAARAGDPRKTLSGDLDQAEVQVTSAAVIARGLGFEACAGQIKVPRPG